MPSASAWGSSWPRARGTWRRRMHKTRTDASNPTLALPPALLDTDRVLRSSPTGRPCSREMTRRDAVHMLRPPRHPYRGPYVRSVEVKARSATWTWFGVQPNEARDFMSRCRNDDSPRGERASCAPSQERRKMRILPRRCC